jgi:hypothetical protein
MNKDEQLAKAMKRVKTTENLRMVFLFPCLLIVLFLFYGNKFMPDNQWFESTKLPLYNVLFFAVIIMLVLSVLRIYFAKSYNDIIRKSRRAEKTSKK